MCRITPCVKNFLRDENSNTENKAMQKSRKKEFDNRNKNIFLSVMNYS